MRKNKNKSDAGIVVFALLLIMVGGLGQRNIVLLLLALLGIPIGTLTWKIRRIQQMKKRYLESGMADVDNLSGEEFEYFLSTYFKTLGYKAKVTPAMNDYGADLIVQKDDVKIVIQAKRYKEKVGIKAVQEVIGAKGFYKADKAMVITCSYFTPNAKNLAKECNIELWDRPMLKSIMEKVQGKELVDEMKRDDEFKTLARKCPLCGNKLILRQGKHGDFYGCDNYPDCKFTKGY
jgi:restriction system protein